MSQKSSLPPTAPISSWVELIFARGLRVAILMLVGGLQTAYSNPIDQFNAKPIIDKHSHDPRWQERVRADGDPEVVLGKDWRRSFWAFSPHLAKRLVSFPDQRPPQPAVIQTADLEPGLEAIELRVAWNVENNSYRCSYHLFVSNSVPTESSPRGVDGAASLPKYPVGIGLDDRSIRKGLLETAMVFSRIQMLSGLTILEAKYAIPGEELTYIEFYQGTCGALGHSSAENLEVGIALKAGEKYLGRSRIVSGRNYAVFGIPKSLVRSGAPYFRRAEKINVCYVEERRAPQAIANMPAAFKEKRANECKKLRSTSIDDAEQPIDSK